MLRFWNKITGKKDETNEKNNGISQALLLSMMPTELLFGILRFVSFRDLIGNVSRTCKTFNVLVSNDNSFFRYCPSIPDDIKSKAGLRLFLEANKTNTKEVITEDNKPNKIVMFGTYEKKRNFANACIQGVMSTIGIEFTNKTFGNTTYQIWDTAGQDRYKAIIASYIRGAKVVLLFSEDNIESAEKLYQLKQQDANGLSRIHFIFVTDSADLAISLREKNYNVIMCDLTNRDNLDLESVFDQIKNICNSASLELPILSKTPAQLEEESQSQFGVKKAKIKANRFRTLSFPRRRE